MEGFSVRAARRRVRSAAVHPRVKGKGKERFSDSDAELEVASLGGLPPAQEYRTIDTITERRRLLYQLENCKTRIKTPTPRAIASSANPKERRRRDDDRRSRVARARAAARPSRLRLINNSRAAEVLSPITLPLYILFNGPE
ncbi:hypothetical protein EVAR_19027_1 [Eumeta japonica]|uniref:Uncharacterized protein n=1 Tax=Eumeta variegata TaxID=151549 RepID=A0A4C1V827_EUMVA|nr:hypothetical protein EVAR_19027_1 [Eumeta japonica]